MRTSARVQTNGRISLPAELCDALGGIEHGDVIELEVHDVRTPPITESEPEADRS